MRILVIEDEPRMSALLFKGLSEHSHDVTVALNGADGLKCTLDGEFEVILLDLGLPDLSGYDVAQVLRERKYPGSILMLTAYNKEDEIVRGLNIGADDYLVKPFSFPELLARLRAITRSSPEPAPTNVAIADMVVDKVQHRVKRRGQSIDLTRTEFLLLEALVQNSPRVVSRARLIEEVWGENAEVTPGALDVLVNSLRSKLDAPFPAKLLHTVRGSGYLLRAAEPAPGAKAAPDYMRRHIQ
jgi:DNA-binding response OmpR family regulator